MKLSREFYNRDTLIVAKDLLGKVLVINNNREKLKVRIVEVEAYTGFEDKASHTYAGRRTKRTEVMYGQAGFLYVFLNYGIHNLINIVTNKKGKGEAVLIRAVEPISEIDLFSFNRYKKKFEGLSKYQSLNLFNGPGKLSKTLKIDKTFYGEDLTGDRIYIEDSLDDDFEIIETKRIGIDYSEEAKDYLYRFYIKGNKYVSIR
ncbi:MAG: DNA-3-methyladenine glycosylase [Peptoniphilaceae bacterium]